MSILDKIKPAIKPALAPDPDKLTVLELEFILNAMKTSTIVGDQVEMFYDLIIKLQNQYIKQQK